MNLPLKHLVDRAGIVGNDGETHHGLFDIAIIKNIPNFILLAPSNSNDLRDMINFAYSSSNPVAIRFPKASVPAEEAENYKPKKFTPGKLKICRKGTQTDVVIFSVGDMLNICLETASILDTKKISCMVVDVVSIKPFDIKMAEKLIDAAKYYITVENAYVLGGFGESMVSEISESCLRKKLFNAGFPDEFIPHGENAVLFKKFNLDSHSLAERVEKAIMRFTK
jgi:1-deoxy-D-xylulose-5-phosphate synthase